MKRPARGAHWEALAERWLRRRGLVTLERNLHCRLGEIDLVMRDGATTVFLEVRYRKNATHGEAHATVQPRKQQRIVRTAQWYLGRRPRLAHGPCRFDVVGISGPRWRPRLLWLQDAFRLD